jgi:pyrroloquinoline quinone (PQQ) biosynthesis protein C
MLANQMLSVVEECSEKMFLENPFSQAAALGLITEKQFTTYLHNLKWIFHNNTVYLQIAKARAEELNIKDLADFLESKFAEEVGHEQWAEDDLKLRNAIPTSLNNAYSKDEFVLPSARRLIQYLDEIIKIDPTLFLSYMFFTEYFTVLVGPRFLQNLEKNCGIPISSVSSIAKHIEADQIHATEDIKIVTQLVKDAPQSKLMMDALYGSIRSINSFLAECVEAIQ